MPNVEWSTRLPKDTEYAPRESVDVSFLAQQTSIFDLLLQETGDYIVLNYGSQFENRTPVVTEATDRTPVSTDFTDKSPVSTDFTKRTPITSEWRRVN